MEIYRAEHPVPQWERKNWRNLNGEWEFEFDFGQSARERELYKTDKLDKKINVPFCPESELSGIGYKDFMNAVCYRRTFIISEEEKKGRTLLHFGACDYETYVYINKELVGSHIGGFASFEFDITDFIKAGENEVFVIAEDNIKSLKQAGGKQSDKYYSQGCFYTRTTGIWQTVWLEFVPKKYIKNAKYYPDIENGLLTVVGETFGEGKVQAFASYDKKEMGIAEINTVCETFCFTINLKEVMLWEVGNGRLYDLELSFEEDNVKSYFGMRNVKIDGLKFLINNKSVFQRLVLDQGYYPDGILTAKTEEALINDIELSLAAGFNGARLHQKVFEPRFLYHCDRLGYIVWGEHGNWGVNYTDAVSVENFTNEWMEIVERDFNHPAIIGWCPFNETWGYSEAKRQDRFLEMNYKLTKLLDKTRPCIDTSGNFHAITDIYDLHDYEQNVEIFKEHIEKFEKTGKPHDNFPNEQSYNKKAVFISEYGGIGWKENDFCDGTPDGAGTADWGYGTNPRTEEEYFERYKGLTDAILDALGMFGFCYTQLCDVEQEINGVYTYSRKPKFDVNKFKKINSRKAKIED